MARYMVMEEAAKGEPTGARETTEGLAVAKALAKKRSQSSSRAVIVRNLDTDEVVARYEPDEKAPALANSVQRMKAANDRLKEALGPAGKARKKRA